MGCATRSLQREKVSPQPRSLSPKTNNMAKSKLQVTIRGAEGTGKSLLILLITEALREGTVSLDRDLRENILKAGITFEEAMPIYEGIMSTIGGVEASFDALAEKFAVEGLSPSEEAELKRLQELR